MKNVKEVMEDKKFVLIITLIRVLHREHLELARLMLMLMVKPDKYKEIFPKMESDWDEILNNVIHDGLKVTEEDVE